jgi:hypothetical protein
MKETNQEEGGSTEGAPKEEGAPREEPLDSPTIPPQIGVTPSSPVGNRRQKTKPAVPAIVIPLRVDNYTGIFIFLIYFRK